MFPPIPKNKKLIEHRIDMTWKSTAVFQCFLTDFTSEAEIVALSLISFNVFLHKNIGANNDKKVPNASAIKL